MSEHSTASSAMAEWVASVRYDELPPAVRDEAVKVLVNSVGTGLGAFTLPDVQYAIGIAKEDGGSGWAPIFLEGARVAAPAAIFANGVMFVTLGQEETHQETAVHPGEVIVPLLLTLTAGRKVTGKELVEALVAGLEVAICFGSPDFLPAVRAEVCETAAVYGALGAAAAAAKMYRLTRSQCAHALGIAASVAGGMSESFAAGTSEFHYSVANAGVHGYHAARLAGYGATAAPTAIEGKSGLYRLYGAVSPEVLEARNVAAELRELLDRRWGMLELVYKPYPVHVFNVPFIDATKLLVQREAIKADEVEAIRLTIPPAAAAYGGLAKGPFTSRDSVVGATAFVVAAAIARGNVSLAELNDYEAAALQELVDRTEIEVGGDVSASRVEIVAAGARHGVALSEVKQDYRLDLDGVSEIFYSAASASVEAEQASSLLNALLEIAESDDVGSTVIPSMMPVGALAGD